MTTTNEYYNVVLNPGDTPALGINDTAERPQPLPEPGPEPQPVNHFDIRTIEIRKIYKFLHFIMFLITFMYSLMTLEEEHLAAIDMIMSATSYFSVLENNINTLKIHVMYLAINFSFATYYLYFEYIVYYFLYTVLDMSTIIHLILDRRDYYIHHLVSVHSNP